MPAFPSTNLTMHSDELYTDGNTIMIFTRIRSGCVDPKLMIFSENVDVLLHIIEILVKTGECDVTSEICACASCLVESHSVRRETK